MNLSIELEVKAVKKKYAAVILAIVVLIGLGIAFYPALSAKLQVNNYRKWAVQGDAFAQKNLGDCYAQGKGVKKDQQQAVYWYRKSAEQGHAEAQLLLGDYYREGQGVAKDIDQAVSLYQKAAEQGNAAAQYNLGNWFLFNKTDKFDNMIKEVKSVESGYLDLFSSLCDLSKKARTIDDRLAVDKKIYEIIAKTNELDEQEKVLKKEKEESEKEAVKWYCKAADQGHSGAISKLGYCYEYDKGVNKDIAKAVKFYRQAADLGDPEAQIRLAFCYDEGNGVDKDFQEAVKWYRKAAEQGSGIAQNCLGRCYLFGHGVDENSQEAVKWYRKAAEQGIVRAQYELGHMYFNGDKAHKDTKEAIKWYRKAAEHLDNDYIVSEFDKQTFWTEFAQVELGHCYHKGEGVKKDFKEAVKWYRKAADNGNGLAEFCLGICYKNGWGVNKDLQQAEKLFCKSSYFALNFVEDVDAEAKLCVGLCYKNGWGVDKDLKEAKSWFEKAAAQGSEEAKNELQLLEKQSKS